MLPGSCVNKPCGEIVMLSCRGKLDRKISRDKSEVGLVEPGRDADNGRTPSPLSSIAIGMFPAFSDFKNGDTI